LLLFTSTAVAAAGHRCGGQVKGPQGSSVGVFIDVADNGTQAAPDVSWTPPGGGDSFPLLFIGYEVAGPGLSHPASVAVASMVKTDPAPASATAEMVVRAGPQSWRKPWRMFAQAMADDHAGKPAAGIPKGGKPVGFFGMVPLAFRGRDNATLLTALDGLASVEVSVEGDRKEHLGVRTYDLSDTKARDALFAQAFIAAKHAAETPSACPAAQ
jgi:hypothetical protein